MSFVSDYLFATSNNESPLVYHKWSCMSALSCIAGRRFWFNLGPFRYYPNFYVCLVGEAGVKKSSAMDMAKDLVRDVGGIPIAATSTSKEAITKEMGGDKYPGKRFFVTNGVREEYNQLAIFATELTSFLGQIAPDAMIDFLTSIYTEKNYDEKYKNAGNTFFAGPFITMLACLTPSTMKGYLKQSLITGGFARRTMFAWGDRGKPIAIPGNTAEQVEAMKRCVAFGKEMQNASGELTFTPEAEVWYKNWYDDNYAKVNDRKPNLQSYFLTKHEFMIKTAMLFTLAEDGKDCRTISVDRLESLDRLFFEPVEKHLDRVFEGAGINPNAQAAAQICRMLEALDKPMPRKTLEAMMYDAATSLNDLRDTINHLVSVGRLVQKNYTSNVGLMGELIGSPKSFSELTQEQALVLLNKKGL